MFDNDSVDMMIKNKPETLMSGKVKDLLNITWADLEALNTTNEEYKKSYDLIVKVIKSSRERIEFLNSIDQIIAKYNHGLKREGRPE